VDTGFWCGNLRENDPLENPGIDGKIILRWIFRMGCEGMDWINVFQDRTRWCTLVDTVMNLQVL
jgi:hypothetical protein